MSNLRKTFDFDPLSLPLTFPKLPPHKTCDDYAASKIYVDSVQFRPFRHDPYFRLTVSQRVLAHTNERLKKKKEYEKHEQGKVEMQWDFLAEMESKLRATFEKMSSFMKSNEDKRVRAQQTIKINQEQTAKRCQDIEILLLNFEGLRKMQQDLDDNIRRLTIYQKYLNRVVDLNEGFKNIDAIIGRYEALITTRNVLGQRQDENLKEMETAKAKTAKMIEDYRFKILGLNNIVADLHSRYNVAFREALDWETLVLTIKYHSYERFRELNEVKQSCYNMYLLMCKRKGEPPKIPEDDVEKQLLYIKKTLQELEYVQEVVRAGSNMSYRTKEKAKRRYKK